MFLPVGVYFFFYATEKVTLGLFVSFAILLEVIAAFIILYFFEE